VRVLLAAGSDAARIAPALEFAAALAESDVDAFVLAGVTGEGDARIERDGRDGRDGRLVRIVRTDPAPHHWQRSRRLEVARLVRSVLVDLRVDLLHVRDHGGLSHDLVSIAASVGVPGLVELDSPAYACLVGDRVRRDVPGPCDAPLSPLPCLACAEADPVHGPTPWVPIEARYLGVAERRRDALRELDLARLVLVHDEGDVEQARRALDSDLARIAWRTLQDAGDAALVAGVYRDALATPRVIAKQPSSEWWVERMQLEAELAWDASFRRARSGA